MCPSTDDHAMQVDLDCNFAIHGNNDNFHYLFLLISEHGTAGQTSTRGWQWHDRQVKGNDTNGANPRIVWLSLPMILCHQFDNAHDRVADLGPRHKTSVGPQSCYNELNYELCQFAMCAQVLLCWVYWATPQRQGRVGIERKQLSSPRSAWTWIAQNKWKMKDKRNKLGCRVGY